MFILYAVLVGLVAGMLIGGRWSGLAALSIRWAPAIVVGMVAQVILFFGPVTELVGGFGPPLYVASTMLVVVAMVRNWSVPGIPVVVVGAACNLVAIVANGGYMPSTAAAMAAAGRHVSEAYTNSSLVADPVLWPLTDIFALPRWLPLNNVFSIGDVLVGIGLAATIAVAMRSRPDVDSISVGPGGPAGASTH
jgi:hypothetical protein